MDYRRVWRSRWRYASRISYLSCNESSLKMNVTALAVIIDSAVTIGVGWRLNRTAKHEVKKAVQEIEPAIRSSVETIATEFQQKTKQEMVKVISKMLPFILKEVRKSRSEPDTTSDNREANSQTQNQPSEVP